MSESENMAKWIEAGKLMDTMDQADLRVRLMNTSSDKPKMAWLFTFWFAGERLSAGTSVYGETATQAIERGHAQWLKALGEKGATGG